MLFGYKKLIPNLAGCLIVVFSGTEAALGNSATSGWPVLEDKIQLAERFVLPSQKRAQTKAKKQRRQNSWSRMTLDEREALCARVVNVAHQAMRDLSKQLSDPYVLATSPLAPPLRYTEESCSERGRPKAVLLATMRAMDQHSGRIGIILPLTGTYATQGQSALNGIKAAAKESRVNLDRAFVILDSGSSGEGSRRALARLLFEYQVSIVIGGLSRKEAEPIANYSKAIRFPAFILHGNPKITGKSEYSFRVYPGQNYLANALAAAMQEKKIKKVALLHPSHGSSDELIRSLKRVLPEASIEITREAKYENGNYNSMDAAVRTIFGLTVESRMDEYRQLVLKRRDEARKSGTAFKASSVILSPDYTFQAVLIPDDFRIVRHFVKLMQYHNVQKIPLIGNHSWRSKDLIQPWDASLKGSFFADFIGSYRELPKSIARNITKTSEYFVSPEQIGDLDYKLIGFRAANLAVAAVRKKVKKRRAFPKALRTLKLSDKFFEGNRLAFDRFRSSRWPTYIFTVADKKFSVSKSNRQPRKNNKSKANSFSKSNTTKTQSWKR